MTKVDALPKENTYIDSRRLILDMDVHRIPNYTTKHKDIAKYNSRRYKDTCI